MWSGSSCLIVALLPSWRGRTSLQEVLDLSSPGFADPVLMSCKRSWGLNPKPWSPELPPRVFQLAVETSTPRGSVGPLFWPLGTAAPFVRSLVSGGHDDALLVVMCRRACLVKWSLRMKRRSHTVQTNFFSPVCVRRWRESSSERANRLSQPSQWQLNGFSPAESEDGLVRETTNTERFPTQRQTHT